MADLPTPINHKKSFLWPEQTVQLTEGKLPKRSTTQKLLGFLVMAMYLAPLMIAATLVEPHLKNEILRKAVTICVFFFGGLSIVMVFASAPSLVAGLYQIRRLKLAESLCRLYLFFVGNFSPYSNETALMYGLLGEILRAQTKPEEAEKAIRTGIEACLICENLSSAKALEEIPDKYKKLAQQSISLAMPTKGMLYETFGSILRDKKMYKLAIEAGKRSIKMIEDKLRELQTVPKDSTQFGTLQTNTQKPMLLALASAQYELALTHLAENNCEPALPLLKSACKIRQENPNTPYYLANVLSALARVYLLSDQSDKAIKHAQEALDMLKDPKLPVEELARARALAVMSKAKANSGKLEEAKRLNLQAKEIREHWLAPTDPERAD